MARPPRSATAWRALVAVLLILVAGYVWPFWPATCGGRFSGMTATDDTGECVGVVSAARHVDGSLDELVRRFDEANAAVADAGGSYVKVVLLTPLSVPEQGAPAIPLEQVRSSLEGAFTAMSRANRTADFGSPSAVRLQVLLANQGSRQEFSEAVVSGILDRDEEEHPVVAVVGLGSSFEGTLQTSRALSDRGIPTVTAIASADDFTARDVAAMRSVSPSNTEYVRALRGFLDTQVVLSSGIVVADQNDDRYTRSLREAFVRELPGFVRFPDLPFNGGTVPSGADAGVFNPVVTNLCNAAVDPDPVNRLDTVLYAGRVADFRGFVDSLNARSCKRQPLAVLVGATGFDAVRAYEPLIEEANVTVLYATSADPIAWAATRPGTPAGFAPFVGQFGANGFDGGTLGDGYAIMYHDALASTATAVRLAAQGDRVPKARDVTTQFGNVTLAYAVRGASGTLSFPPSTDGRAVGKLIPLRQVGRSTPIRLPDDRCTYVVGAPCARP